MFYLKVYVKCLGKNNKKLIIYKGFIRFYMEELL